MLIRYAGPKPIKIVNVSGKDFTFNPTCEFNPIFDVEIIKWLLAPERAGLFVVEAVEDATPSKMQPEMTQVTPQETFSPTGRKLPSKPKKRRGRPRKR